LTYTEACDKLEEYYLGHAMKLASLSKIKSRMSASSPTVEATQPVKEAKEPSPTLTNALSSATQATPDTSKMSKEDYLDLLAKKIRVIDN
jgi:hypothetical protein